MILLTTLDTPKKRSLNYFAEVDLPRPVMSAHIIFPMLPNDSLDSKMG